MKDVFGRDGETREIEVNDNANFILPFIMRTSLWNIFCGLSEIFCSLKSRKICGIFR